MGTAHPFVLTSASFHWRWVAGCQARQDTDQDGVISVGKGGRGELAGDRLQAYLWTSNGNEESIDAFIQSSSDGRYVAFVQSGHLIVLDARTQQRTDLNHLGARVTDLQDLAAPDTLLAFANGPWAVFRRQVQSMTQLVAVQFDTHELHVLYETQDVMDWLWFAVSNGALVIVKPKPDQRAHRHHFRRHNVPDVHYHCSRSEPFEQLELLKDAAEPLRIPVSLPNARVPHDERIIRVYRNVAEGHPVLARSSLGGFLIAAEPNFDSTAMANGPVQWVQLLEEPTDVSHPPQHAPSEPDTAAPGNAELLTSIQEPTDVQPPRHPAVTRTSLLFVEKTVGVNAVLGLWHFNARELNQGFAAQGYSTTGQSHTLFGVELFLGYGRWRGTFGIFGLNSKNVQLLRDHDVEGAIYGGGGQLSAAYSLLKLARFSVMPELGIKGVFTDIDFSQPAPPLALGGEYAFFGQPKLETAALLMDFGLRWEARAIELDAGYDDHTYLTLGNYIGWEQQFTAERWNIFDNSDYRGSFSHHNIDRTGPLGLVYVGVLHSK